ncbi:hypothetical protein ABT072_28205 [Streptomyces sp. NPDC002589]|uniref:hypothetical protein n=1 Tax=Streptomyces sp. NPDC002589 TaxID=3154420 RepID=UPI0033279442
MALLALVARLTFVALLALVARLTFVARLALVPLLSFVAGLSFVALLSLAALVAVTTAAGVVCGGCRGCARRADRGSAGQQEACCGYHGIMPDALCSHGKSPFCFHHLARLYGEGAVWMAGAVLAERGGMARS